MTYGWRRGAPRPFSKSFGDGLVFVVVLTLLVMALDRAGLLRPESGQFIVVDGDSLRRGGSDFRLFGIDAPELHQECRDRHGASYPCGAEARRALAGLAAGRDLTCLARDRDRYGRSVVQCTAGSLDINAEMVRLGWAIAYRHHALDYVAEEAAAEAARRGIWQGSFEEPERWRAANRNGVWRGDLGD